MFLAIFLYGAVFKVGVFEYFSLNRRAYYLAKESNDALYDIFLNFALVVFCFLLVKRSQREQGLKFLVYVSIFIFIILLPTGARGTLFISFILAGILILTSHKVLDNKRLIVPGIIGLLFFQLFGKIRHLTNNPTEIPNFLNEKFSIILFDFSSGESHI